MLISGEAAPAALSAHGRWTSFPDKAFQYWEHHWWGRAPFSSLEASISQSQVSLDCLLNFKMLHMFIAFLYVLSDRRVVICSCFVKCFWNYFNQHLTHLIWLQRIFFLTFDTEFLDCKVVGILCFCIFTVTLWKHDPQVSQTKCIGCRFALVKFLLRILLRYHKDVVITTFNNFSVSVSEVVWKPE